MSKYGSIADDFYVNMNLNTELDLPTNRDTLLHFFEQLRKQFPSMRNFYSRERGDYVLEEDKDSGDYRWATTEQKRICSGYVNPPDVETAFEQHAKVLESVPYSLSVSPLDCESLNFMFGFDYAYRGNHHALLAEALGMVPAFERMAEIPGARIVVNEPLLQLALEEDCRTQCRVGVESRTTAYHIRTGEFSEEQISVYLTMRHYGSLETDQTYVSKLKELRDRAIELLDNYVVDSILIPLQQAIAIK